MKRSEIERLERLRHFFLSEDFLGRQEDYWRDQEDLELYHRFFAERIRWKWEFVLGKLNASDFNGVGEIIDFGCGTGVGAMSFGLWLRAKQIPFDSIQLIDRSVEALRFSERKVNQLFPNLDIFTSRQLNLEARSSERKKVLLFSHLLNEAQESTLEKLIKKIRAADFFVWIEPGTPWHAKEMIKLRESLCEVFDFLAPCPHQGPCGFARKPDKKEREWCHFFAQTPREIFQQAEWSIFANKMNIDLHSLPLSYLVGFQNHDHTSKTKPTGRFRCLGRARSLKGSVQQSFCSESGIKRFQLTKRKHPELVTILESSSGELLDSDVLT